MGVYIDIMKPKWCSECPMWSDTRGCHMGADDYDDCPLIEIDDIQYKAFLEFSEKLMKRLEEHILYGERRADE